MNARIDLNADMGEYADAAQRAVEAALMPLITSCSIACGGHAGDNASMRATAQLACKHGVAVGAHPSYPDVKNFGRKSLRGDLNALRAAISDQVTALRRILDEEGMVLRHVKPHGALYGDAAGDVALAEMIAEAAHGATLIGPSGSALQAASASGFIAEGFVDRRYLASGALAPRGEPGAVIKDIAARAAQALTLARNDTLDLADGAITLHIDTLCIHSDTPGAVETAIAVRNILEADGFTIAALEPRK
ncbi:Lactam utilization protein LamB [hydrothermal vent metagenome]|uniref:Lactam utilization protein LamB n=1 Tax=hydrothermal vent metagenome TaxID=652676 RepID=A0A3B0SDP8_9ZZZZ